MADIVNLRTVRKRKARAEKEDRAAQNRVAFGLSKAERALASTERSLAERRLDTHKRDGDSD
ncbi:DUF4169 family protein [Microvirga antarctica]|uniref:DUF4169 family protein n=1 Tax=Microvirga antarctica TaxID=2819233 RepID=UPI001B309D98|nr:DUF4169 family protein [Microvirga antarctica]